MDLVPCSGCNRQISPNAHTCPLCGEPGPAQQRTDTASFAASGSRLRGDAVSTLRARASSEVLLRQWAITWDNDRFALVAALPEIAPYVEVPALNVRTAYLPGEIVARSVEVVAQLADALKARKTRASEGAELEQQIVDLNEFRLTTAHSAVRERLQLEHDVRQRIKSMRNSLLAFTRRGEIERLAGEERRLSTARHELVRELQQRRGEVLGRVR